MAFVENNLTIEYDDIRRSVCVYEFLRDEITGDMKKQIYTEMPLSLFEETDLFEAYRNFGQSILIRMQCCSPIIKEKLKGEKYRDL